MQVYTHTHVQMHILSHIIHAYIASSIHSYTQTTQHILSYIKHAYIRINHTQHIQKDIHMKIHLHTLIHYVYTFITYTRHECTLMK